MKKKYETLSEEFFKLSVELKQECIKYLTRLLKKREDHVIYFNECDTTLTVVYDGGNNPEYASNAFSVVKSIYLEDDNIYIDTEDTTAYIVDYLTTEELYDICSFIGENKL